MDNKLLQSANNTGEQKYAVVAQNLVRLPGLHIPVPYFAWQAAFAAEIRLHRSSVLNSGH